MNKKVRATTFARLTIYCVHLIFIKEVYWKRLKNSEVVKRLNWYLFTNYYRRLLTRSIPKDGKHSRE